MRKVLIKNIKTSETIEGFLECIYYNYLVIILNKNIKKRIVLDIFDEGYSILMENSELQKELYNLFDSIKRQNFDIKKIQICNCFRNILCINCLFVHANKLLLKNDNIIFSHRIDVYTNNKKYLGLFSDIFTYNLPLKSNVPDISYNDILNYNMSIEESLANFSKHYNSLFYHFKKAMKCFDVRAFFEHYSASSNLDLYLLNEAVLLILINSSSDFLDLFFAYLGEMIKYINHSPNFIKLLIGLCNLSKFRMTEVVITYDLFTVLKIKDSLSAFYCYKLYQMLDKDLISRFDKKHPDFGVFKDNFFRFNDQVS